MISAAIIEQDEVILARYMSIMELMLVNVVVQEVDNSFAFEGVNSTMVSTNASLQ